jgi:hypothetical protein
MKQILMAPVARLAVILTPRRDALWDALEWLAMPVFMLYPQLVVLKCYRYGS